MDTNLAAFLISAVIVAVLAFPLGNALRRHPVPFYVAVIAITALYLWAIGSGVRLTGVRMLAVIMQKGYLASLMLAVVMFTGCFDEGTPIRKHLQPIRGELSILSFVFILGHLATYLPSYLGRFGAIMSASSNVAASLVLALVLTAVFAVLTVLSFRVVRRKMDPHAWKVLQRGAYVMVALLAVHVALVLWKSAVVAQQPRALVSLVAYLTVVAVWAVARVAKCLRDRSKKAAVVVAKTSEVA